MDEQVIRYHVYVHNTEDEFITAFSYGVIFTCVIVIAYCFYLESKKRDKSKRDRNIERTFFSDDKPDPE